MAVGNLRKIAATAAASVAVGLLLASCSNANSTVSGTNNNSQGVTSNSISVGVVASLSGQFSEGFGDIVYGEKAYFNMINSEGGVDGRKINLNYVLDDGGSGSNNEADIRQLVVQDKVFAITGIGSAAFNSASYLAQTGTPTFGYNVTANWQGPKNLFAENGSVEYFPGAVPGLTYAIKQLHVKSVAVVAYPFVSVSKDACAAVVQGLTNNGIHVGFQDLNLGYAEDPSADVQKMKAANVDMLYTCTDGPENLRFAQTMQQYGVKAYTVWDNGYDRSLVTAQDTIIPSEVSTMSNSIFFLQHVPFQAQQYYPNTYPGMNTYLRVMKQSEPNYVYDDNAYWGWAAASNFVQGLKEVKAANLPLTQGNLVNEVNKEVGFNAGGTLSAILPDWDTAHTSASPPFCGSYVLVQPDGTMKPILVQNGNETLVCFNGATATTPESPLPAHMPPNP